MYNIIDNLEEKKKNIYFMFVRELISFDDINEITSYTIYDFSNMKKLYKNRVLLNIYINPYLLCNDNIVRIDGFNMDILSKLLIKRYNDEIYEYNNRLMNGDISYLEYCNSVMVLNNLYFTSTMIGDRISNMNKDKIIKKVKSR